MSILNIYKTLFLLLTICFSITAASAFESKSKCRATGKLFITNYWDFKQLSNESIEKEIRSPEVINKVIKELKLENINSNSISAKELIRGITIESVDNENIIQISYEYPDTQLAIQVVNSFMKNYSLVKLSKNKKQAIILAKLIEKRVKQKNKELEVAGKILRELCEGNENKTKDKKELIMDAQIKFEKLQNDYYKILEKLQELRVIESRNNSGVSPISYANWSCYKY